MKNKQEQIRKLADAISYECQQSKTCDNCFERGRVCSDYNTAEKLYSAGYRKASEVIDEFVERINLIECEMFHKAHDVRNSCEYKIDHGNTDDRVWGDKRACDGKMVALQDFMTKIEKLADEMRQEVEK